MLRGQYPHNTQVMRNGPPQGGHETFVARGLEDDTVGHWLREAGYTTGFVGKYMNGYDASYKPPGWSSWYAKADGGHLRGEGQRQRPHKEPRGGREDVDRAGSPRRPPGSWTGARTGRDAPFALFFWPTQPHLEAGDYAERYADLYRNEPLNSKPSFDEADVSDKPRWIRELPRIGDAKTRPAEAVEAQPAAEPQAGGRRRGGDAETCSPRRGELENTYVVYTTDNGTGMGDHRWFNHHGMKQTPYEEAANVYSFVRGPGVDVGSGSASSRSTTTSPPRSWTSRTETVPDFVDGRTHNAHTAATPRRRPRSGATPSCQRPGHERHRPAQGDDQTTCAVITRAPRPTSTTRAAQANSTTWTGTPTRPDSQHRQPAHRRPA